MTLLLAAAAGLALAAGAVALEQWPCRLLNNRSWPAAAALERCPWLWRRSKRLKPDSTGPKYASLPAI